jgi:hypothetical protein
MLDNDRRSIWWRGRECPFDGETQYFLMELLVEGRGVDYAEIGEWCLGNSCASAAAIRQLKRRTQKTLRAHNMDDLAGAIVTENETMALNL